MKEHGRAAEDYHLARKIFEFVGEKRDALKAGLVLGSSYLSLQKFDKALAAYGRSLRELKEEGEERGAVSALCNIGKGYERRGETAKSAEYYEKGLHLSKKLGYEYGVRMASGYLDRLRVEGKEH